MKRNKEGKLEFSSAAEKYQYEQKKKAFLGMTEEELIAATIQRLTSSVNRGIINV